MKNKSIVIPIWILFFGSQILMQTWPAWDSDYPSTGRTEWIDYIIIQETNEYSPGNIITYVWHDREIVKSWRTPIEECPDDYDEMSLAAAHNYVAKERLKNPPGWLSRWATPPIFIDTMKIPWYDTLHIIEHVITVPNGMKEGYIYTWDGEEWIEERTEEEPKDGQQKIII